MGTSALRLVQPPFVRDAPAAVRSGHPDGAGTAGHRDVTTTIYTHVLDRLGRGLISPRDRTPVAGSEDRGDVEARRWRERADVDLNRAAQAIMLV